MKEYDTLGSKPVEAPMDTTIWLDTDLNDALDDPSWHRKLIGKLIYLIVTRLDISSSFGVQVGICSLPISSIAGCLTYFEIS